MRQLTPTQLAPPEEAGEVWALNLLPVVRERRAGQPGPADTFSDEQLALIVELRERKRLTWDQIGRTLQRPMRSCQRRYFAIAKARPQEEPKPKSLSAAARKSDHERMGIKTYQVEKWLFMGTVRDRKINITLSAGNVGACDD